MKKTALAALGFLSVLAANSLLCKANRVLEDTNHIKHATMGIEIDALSIRAAIVIEGTVKILKNEQGAEQTPAYVAFDPNGNILIGDEAKCQVTQNPFGTAFAFLDLLAASFDSASVTHNAMLMPYKLQQGNKSSVAIAIERNGVPVAFAPEELLAILLRHMRELAEQIIPDKKVTSAVISVPDCLSYAQVLAVRDSAKIAGFSNGVRIIKPTEASAIAYGAHRTEASDSGVLVLHAGDNSLSAGVFEFSGKGDVTTQAGDCLPDAGGVALQQVVLNYAEKIFKSRFGHQWTEKQLLNYASVKEKQRREAERLVRTFATGKEAEEFQVDSVLEGGDLKFPLSRSQFLKLGEKIQSKARTFAARLYPRDKIDKTLFTGAIRIPEGGPQSAQSLEDALPGTNIDLATLPVIGAAIHADQLSSSGSAVPVISLCAHTLAYKINGRSPVIMLHKGEVIPNENMDLFSASTAKGFSAVHIQVLEVTANDYEFIGNVTLNVSPTSQWEISIKFKMEKYNELQVEIEEMNTMSQQVAYFTHGLSRFHIQRMKRRLNEIFKRRNEIRVQDIVRQEL